MMIFINPYSTDGTFYSVKQKPYAAVQQRIYCKELIKHVFEN